MQIGQQNPTETQEEIELNHGFWLSTYVWLSILGSLVVIGLCIESTPILHWVHGQVVIATSIIEQMMSNLLPTLSLYGVQPAEFTRQLQTIANTPYTISDSLLISYSVIATVNIVGCIGIWYWQKWGCTLPILVCWSLSL